MPEIKNFTLLSAGYFCVPVNTLELYSGDTMKLLGYSWILSGLALIFVRQHQRSV